MKSKTLAAAAAAALTLAAAGVAEAAVRTTKITISHSDEEFRGALSSSRGSCESDRKVTLFKVTTKNGQVKSRTRVGSDTSNDDGDWTVESERTGRFQASVASRGNCGAATSKIIKVVNEDEDE